ncbi:DUF3859 domain-containing protein [Jannaschia marina]|uniref:DUF3859 domain-containing protein n=1 Tax=Jannaschia marina TaxID=2741674 RepID=UPI0015C7348B|nr:DUF3859 domain-containing protein [Jannaschia marina]
MRHRLKPLLIPLVLALSFGAGAARAEITLLRAGIVCPDGRDGPMRDAPDTLIGGVREVDGLAIDLDTRDVPMIPGLGLGLQTRWEGPGGATLRMVTLHPPMGENGVTEQSYTRDFAPGETSTRAYTFEFAYEMVPGPWTLQIADATGTLISVDFTVSDTPNAAVTEVCGLFLNS